MLALPVDIANFWHGAFANDPKIGMAKSCKAVVVREHGPPEKLVFEDVGVEDPGAGEVLLETRAVGLNFPDTLIIQGKYQFQPAMPFSPGGEMSGVVRAVGEGVKSVKVGDRVAAMTGWGAMREFVTVEAAKVFKVPEGVDDATASGMMMTYGTTMHAFRQRGNLKAGETVLVLGAAGGVGLSAVDVAKAMGATVIAAASSADKLAVCKEYGADHLINYTTEDLRKRVKEITGGQGVDVIYDPVGDKFGEPCVRSLGWNGRYLVIGFAGGEIPKIKTNLLLLKSAAIVGVFWGAFTSREPENFAENTALLFKWIAQGKLRPLVTQTYALADSAKAIRDMMDRKIKGKAVILCTPSKL